MTTQNFSQSVPTNYFTPKKRSQTGQKSFSNKSQKSTAQKYYDLEDSFKQYEKLLSQNLYLKGLLVNQNQAEQSTSKKLEKTSLFRETQNINDKFQKSYGRNPSTKCLSTNAFNQSSSENSFHDAPSQSNYFRDNDITLWSIKKRNTYLEQKLTNLQKQYTKQTNTIDKIVHSSKWKNRNDCKQSSCYADKYMKLLRVRSPVLLQ